jgi:acyl dehydratase
MARSKLTFDQVKEGDTAPVQRHELNRTDLVMYAGASGDFNPMHHDDTRATAAGFAKQTWPGDDLTARCTVVRKRVENGTRLVDLECSLVDAKGEVKVSGEATAELPA